MTESAGITSSSILLLRRLWNAGRRSTVVDSTGSTAGVTGGFAGALAECAWQERCGEYDGRARCEPAEPAVTARPADARSARSAAGRPRGLRPARRRPGAVDRGRRGREAVFGFGHRARRRR